MGSFLSKCKEMCCCCCQDKSIEVDSKISICDNDNCVSSCCKITVIETRTNKDITTNS